MILYSEGATKAQEEEANQVLEALTTAYPNHPWSVRVYDGGFFIQHLDFDGNHGMNCKYKKFGFSWSAMKREIIMMAGEFLERAGLRRGIGDGEQEIIRVEGVPEKWQPAQHREKKFVPNIAVAESALRDKPHREEKKHDPELA